MRAQPACLPLLLLLLTWRGAECGQLLQLSDFHYDADYDVQGQPERACHRAENRPPAAALGPFGDYKCDAPRSLVQSAVRAAAALAPRPNVLLWTGDNVPHIDTYGEDYVRNALRFTTAQIGAQFGGVPVLPTLGNHDVAPANQFAAHDRMYQITWDLWQQWLKPENKESYLKGGYYAQTVGGAVFLVLNTNLYYVYDHVNFTDAADPAGQFAFAERTLQEARRSRTAVNIVAHIPPGLFERVPDIKWFRDEYNKRFIDLIRDYNSVIKLLIFGHHHTDTFHIIRDRQGEPLQVCFISPAVTPWYSSLGLGANNPAFRVFDYTEGSWELSDVLTYYVNLGDLNRDASTQWRLEYSFKRDYAMPDLSAAAFARLATSMAHNRTLLQQYMTYNGVGYDSALPNDTIVRAQLCSLQHADYADYGHCMQSVAMRNVPLIAAIFMSFPLFALRV